MDEYVKFTEKTLLKYCKMIYDKKYSKQIAQRYIDTYINVRYSNYIDEENKKLNIIRKISRALDYIKKELKLEYNDSMYPIIDELRNFSSYFYTLDQLYLLEAQKKAILDINEDRKKFLGIEEDFTDEFSLELRNDIKKRKDFLDGFESTTFKLELKKFNKNDFGVKLENNIVFPDLYSDVAIKRVGLKDTICEDITSIGFLLTSCAIINDLISCNFEKYYHVYLPASFFDKKTKVSRVFNIIDNVYIQDKIRSVITYSCFMRYKSYVMEFMRQGFVFAIYLDEDFEYSSENIRFLELFDKIFIENSKYYYKDMKNNVKIGNRIIGISEV